MYRLTESEKAQISAHLFKNTISPISSGKEVLELNEKQSIFAKEFVKRLFENIVYNETFECAECDKSSTRFAESFVSERKAQEIVASTMKAFPTSAPEEMLKEAARIQADSMTKLWIEDGKFQLIEVEEAVENAKAKSINIDSKILSERFSLYKEFDALFNTTKDESGDVSKSLISEMSQEEKMKLALRKNAFKSSMGSVGFDLKDDKLLEAIEFEFSKNLF